MVHLVIQVLAIGGWTVGVLAGVQMERARTRSRVYVLAEEDVDNFARLMCGAFILGLAATLALELGA